MFLRIELRSKKILLILQLETDYFSKLFISEMHSKQWHYSLHRDFQNCYSTRRSPTGFFKLQLQFQLQLQLQFYKGYPYTIHPPYNIQLHLHVHIQRILHPEIQFYMQKTKSSSSTTLQIPEILRIEGKEIF